MRIVFSAHAKAGLRRISLHIARDSKARVLSFVSALRQKAHDIGRNPLAYPLVPRFEAQGIRRRVFRDYLIFYRVDSHAVHILHIQHRAQSYEELLFLPE